MIPMEVDERSIVMPGQTLAEGMDYLPGPGAFRDGDAVRSRYVGLVDTKNDRVVRVIPVSGRYQPQEGDIILGEVVRVSHSNWFLDTNSPYDAVLPLAEASDEYIDLDEEELADYFDVGDLLVAKIQRVTRGMDVQVTMKDRLCRKLESGQVIEIAPAKVPRLIGKRGTMVNTIKKHTNCTIVVGQNGRVWVEGENDDVAEDAIRLVEENAHTSGLTERVTDYLEDRVDGDTDAS